jgi:hypothetical protein
VVEADLRDDPANAALIDAIRRLVAGPDATPTSIEPCGPDADESPTEDDADGHDQRAFPEGVYRAEHMFGSLVEAGVDHLTASYHAGLWTLRFDDGQLLVEYDGAGELIVDEGVYCVEDGRVVLGSMPSGTRPRAGTSGATWELDGDLLGFEDVVSHHGSHPDRGALGLAAVAADRVNEPPWLVVEWELGGQPCTRAR